MPQAQFQPLGRAGRDGQALLDARPAGPPENQAADGQSQQAGCFKRDYG
jgi:hypothetical protein